uniref:NADH dehydrogenase subunit 4 n=1 Tax=Ibla cumingi TaxID=58185 RepID=UPI0021CC6C37|nr:NADH dehydrogenase subunit 4 [Ibla cumingi]UWM12942.1 NADH dehydrogenase subunit 4 [Ibla cumingi]
MLKFLVLLLSMMMMSVVGEFLMLNFYLVVAILLWLFMYTELVVSEFFLSSDVLSWFLVLLTLCVVLFMNMASQGYFVTNYYPRSFLMTLLLMLVMLFLAFTSSDLLMFYFFFESSLFPIYVLIVGWGYQPERLQAGVYLLLYTLFASLPLLVSLLFMVGVTDTSDFCGLSKLNLSVGMGLWFFFSVFAFLVKLPAYFVHLWLPKAHVEAPVSGSMMLAGVMLKLGCYGMMRLFVLFDGMVVWVSSMLVSLGLLGGLMVSLICLRQVDYKALIAYSSVSHMGLALGGLGAWNLWGYSACLYMCIAHGLCSSGLFFLSGVVFERSGSRSMLINKGLLEIMPSMAFWWFIFCIGNMAAPVVLNLVGELALMGSILFYSSLTLFFLMLFSFFGACYSLYLFSSLQHGKSYSGLRSMTDGTVREFLILILHYYPLFLLILEVDFMSY